MSISELFWIFLIFTALQPVIRQRWLDASRARLLRRIQQARGTRVISLVHRQETMSLLGFPVFRYIHIDDSKQVIRATPWRATTPRSTSSCIRRRTRARLGATHDYPILPEAARDVDHCRERSR
jgi:hypothetical protein